MTIANYVKSRDTKAGRKREPLWRGPESDHDQGGITFSLLSRFLVCRERFRIHAVEGLHPVDKFNHRLEFGSMWHVCEEAYAASSSWEDDLKAYAQALCVRYRSSQEDIVKWYNVVRVQFPLYVAYWARHCDMKNRTPLLSEQVFRVPYQLPSGRTVYLRGKWDSADIVTDSKGKASVWLQENKTKGDIRPELVQRQLRFDLQTMLYLVALQKDHGKHPFEIAGVRYNCVRRPLSGGKGSIVRHKATKNQPEENLEHYYGRLRTIIQEAEEPDGSHYFFMRWNVDIGENDVARFRCECLDPVLENLCNWYEYTTGMGSGVIGIGLHWRHPFGVFNSLDEGGSSDLDAYLETGSEVGLTRVDTIFPELK